MLQFSIALCTGLVAATFVPPVRRSIPRPVEIVLWIVFLTVSLVGVTSITDPNARELTSSAAWGVDQLLSTVASLLAAGAAAWIFDNRFAIDRWMAIIAGLDLIALTVLRSMHNSRGWQPRMRLRDWMELPAPVAETGVRITAPSLAPVVDAARRLVALAAIAGAAFLTELVEIAMWVRDTLAPEQRRRLAIAAGAGRTGTQAHLEAMREAAVHLAFAARAWYAAAAAPAVARFASGAGQAMRSVRDSRLPARATQVIEITSLMRPESLGWYGPPAVLPPPAETELDPDAEDAIPQRRSDRLAS